MTTKTKKKGCDRPSLVTVTERDKDIFRALSSGATTFLQLKSIMEKMHKKKLPERVLRVRLAKLKSANYITSRAYANRNGQGKFALYVLTKLSSDILCDVGYPPGSIRCTLPNDYMVAHDLMVTETVRAIKKEGANIYLYEIWDDNVLKKRKYLMKPIEKVRHKKNIKKGEAFPDLYVRITLERKGRRQVHSYDMEIDNNTEMPAVVVDKARRHFNTTIILCTLTSRIDSLRRTCVALGDPDLRNKVYFALISDFSANGFLESNWIDAEGTRAVVFDLET